ncbi:MAG: ATP-binding protein [Candidatus Omnitrophota bacterium]|nr:ATP-binding protein [Candidatus Omnitrophota bacterium]
MADRQRVRHSAATPIVAATPSAAGARPSWASPPERDTYAFLYISYHIATPAAKISYRPSTPDAITSSISPFSGDERVSSHTDESRRCPSTKVAAYLAKVSGPLLDRTDLHIEVAVVPHEGGGWDAGWRLEPRAVRDPARASSGSGPEEDRCGAEG